MKFKYPSRKEFVKSFSNTRLPEKRPEFFSKVNQLVCLLEESKELELRTISLKTFGMERQSRAQIQQQEDTSELEENSIMSLLDMTSDSEEELQSDYSEDIAFCIEDAYTQDGDHFYHSKRSQLVQLVTEETAKDFSSSNIVWCDKDFVCQWGAVCSFVLFGPDVPGGDVDFRTVLEAHFGEHIGTSPQIAVAIPGTGISWECKWGICNKSCTTAYSLLSHVRKKHIPLDERTHRIPLTESTALIQRRFRLNSHCLTRLEHIKNVIQKEQQKVSSGSGNRYKITDGSVAKFLHLLAREGHQSFKSLGWNK